MSRASEFTGKIACYTGCFLLGAVITVLAEPVLSLPGEFLFGFEIQSTAAFPDYHRAGLDPGPGDRTLTLEIDGKTILTSAAAAAPGEPNVKLLWDRTDRLIISESDGQKIPVDDARNRVLRKER